MEEDVQDTDRGGDQSFMANHEPSPKGDIAKAGPRLLPQLMSTPGTTPYSGEW